MPSAISPHYAQMINRTRRWLTDLRRNLDTEDPEFASRALRATLHALRDRLPPAETARLAGQLPTPIHALFQEDWSPQAREPDQTLVDCARRRLQGDGDDAQAIVAAVCRTLQRNLPPEASQRLRDVLGAETDAYWPATASRT